MLLDAYWSVKATDSKYDEPLSRYRLAVGEEVRLGSGNSATIEFPNSPLKSPTSSPVMVAGGENVPSRTRNTVSDGENVPSRSRNRVSDGEIVPARARFRVSVGQRPCSAASSGFSARGAQASAGASGCSGSTGVTSSPSSPPSSFLPCLRPCWYCCSVLLRSCCM